jgi:hypothetical protein
MENGINFEAPHLAYVIFLKPHVIFLFLGRNFILFYTVIKTLNLNPFIPATGGVSHHKRRQVKQHFYKS